MSRHTIDMDQLIKKIIAGAVGGFVSAFLVDLDAWKASVATDKFDWAKAVKRWVAGAISGAITVFGVGELV